MSLLMSGFASSDPLEPPHQKIGLWQQVVTRNGVAIPMGSSQVCLDQAAEEKRQQAMYSPCRSLKVTRGPDGSWLYACLRSDGSTRVTRVTGDFDRKIATTLESAANDRDRVVMTATWLGPCKAGQRGGDVILPNGVTVNALDIANAKHAVSKR